jgi:type II secretory pathway pseudopilin PulG
MPDLSRLRLIRGQGGSTLIELLVAMPMAVALLGLVSQAFVTGSQDQRRLERRAAALYQAHNGLERMTREMRQANWVYFTSSQIVDLEAMVRRTTTSDAVQRHVRYDCSAGYCTRYEGPAVPYPPSVAAIWESSALAIGSPPGDPLKFDGKVLGSNIFVPKRVDPVTGATEVNYLDPDLLHIRLLIRVNGLKKPIEIADGVSLRNRTNFAK